MGRDLHSGLAQGDFPGLAHQRLRPEATGGARGGLASHTHHPTVTKADQCPALPNPCFPALSDSSRTRSRGAGAQLRSLRAASYILKA